MTCDQTTNCMHIDSLPLVHRSPVSATVERQLATYPYEQLPIARHSIRPTKVEHRNALIHIAPPPPYVGLPFSVAAHSNESSFART